MISFKQVTMLAGAAAVAFTAWTADVAVTAQSGAAVDPSLYAGMRWRSVGPARGGRSIAVGGSDARPNEYWFGATGGGAWKTTDGGSNWEPMTDGKIATSSIGSLAVCQSNPDVVYIGGGETEFRGNIIQGDGIYKTTDGGKTWTHLPQLRDSQAIARLRLHPANCDVVFAAVFGQVYSDHPERGVFKSTDGGQTFKKTLYRDEKTPAIDLSIDPTEPERDVRRALGGEPQPMGDVEWRPRQRPVQIDGRRRHLVGDHEEHGPAVGHLGQGWRLGLPGGWQSRLCPDREREGRPVRLRRRRRDLEADQREPQPAPARVLLHAPAGGSRRTRTPSTS